MELAASVEFDPKFIKVFGIESIGYDGNVLIHYPLINGQVGGIIKLSTVRIYVPLLSL